ncbi:MAG: hypothetical protein F4Y63_01445 [Chloroflexi bacterium]|nr:hypothetical protein [Chloroflexota bacterium]MYK60712.1 hypothetical protein [Chloroflexota bacterium]
MDFGPIYDGLQVSGIGMGMTSVVLIILAVSVRLMAFTDAYLRKREATAKEASENETSDQPASEQILVDESSSGPARAAAIAVAIALSRRSQEIHVSGETRIAGNATNSTYDAWLTEGRARQRAKQGSRGWR